VAGNYRIMPFRPFAFILAALLSVALSLAPALAAQSTGAKHGMVASASGLASQVGIDTLKRGGNAVDAAVAVGLALAVVYPEAGNLGGGGFMLIRMADGRSTAVDYREVAPTLATRTMYLDKKGNMVKGASLAGYRAVGVPGTVAGLALAQRRYGKLSWRQVVEPARRLASQGFRVSPALAASLQKATSLNSFAESHRVFGRGGGAYRAGEVLRQPDLAATLGRLEKHGPREFYTGRTGHLLARDMVAHGGLVTLSDLKHYRAVERTPLRGMYRGCGVLTMPPPSSGGIALLEMLNVLERFDIRRMGYGTVPTDHLLIEAMRRAFADRSAFGGDPDFVRVPVQGLTSKAYAAQIAKTIHLTEATPSAQVGHGRPQAFESQDTTHFSVVDAQGNAVSNTYTLNFLYGSGVTAVGTGVLLNDEMDDFAAKPGSPNGFGLIQGEANAIGPRKRPLSSMTPTILTRNGKLFLVIGSPGGPTIINTVLQVILNVVDHGMSLSQAIAAPRLHHQWLPDLIRYESGAVPPPVRAALEAEGHRFAPAPGAFPGSPTWGDAEGIFVDPRSGKRHGASDPRSKDARAMGY